MKRLMLVVLCLMIATPAFAGRRDRRTTIIPAESKEAHSVIGWGVDAPHLVGVPIISKDLFIGVEGGKQVLVDAFRPNTRRYVEDDRGYYGMVKATYNGCVLFCP